MIDNKQTLSIIYNNWYAYQLGSPTPKQQDNFWQAVFETEDEQFIKEKILDADLDRVLIKYIEHIMRTQKMNEKKLPVFLKNGGQTCCLNTNLFALMCCTHCFHIQN